MRHAAQVALRRSTGYVKIFDHELEVLDTLPLWMERLFRVLVQFSSYSTGLGSTTYPQLVEAMTPLQPRSGPRHYVPDEWAIWRALVAFDRAHIVWRNTGFSQMRGVIVFELAPRKAPARPKPNLHRGPAPPTTSLQNEQRRGL